MSAAEIAGRVGGPTYLSGRLLGIDGAAPLGAGDCVASSAERADEHAPTTISAALPKANEIGLTGLRGWWYSSVAAIAESEAAP